MGHVLITGLPTTSYLPRHGMTDGWNQTRWRLLFVSTATQGKHGPHTVALSRPSRGWERLVLPLVLTPNLSLFSSLFPSPLFSLPMSTTPSMEALKARYDAAGQGHLFTFYPTLAPADQAALLSQLAELDVERVNRIYHKAIESEQGLTKMTTNTVASPEATARADTEVVSPAHPAEEEVSVVASPYADFESP